MTCNFRADTLYHVGKTGLSEITPGQSGGFTDAGEWADKIYKGRPIYLSIKKTMYPIGRDLQEYKIIRTMLDKEKLRADLPSLVDNGMYITEDGKGWWEAGQEPSALKPYLNRNGEILLITLSKLWQPAMDITRTVAYQAIIFVSN